MKTIDVKGMQCPKPLIETKKALNLLAQNLERGTEKVAYLNEFEQTKQKIYNNN